MMQNEIIFCAQESPQGGYEAQALGHPIFTQADSIDGLKEMIRDAETCRFMEDAIPIVTKIKFSQSSD